MLDVINPSDGISCPASRAPLWEMSTRRSAQGRAAFPARSASPIKERVRLFFRYRARLEQHREELAALIIEEHGKIQSEAEAEPASTSGCRHQLDGLTSD